MAGNYPDYTDHRMAYDQDGTQVYWIRLDTSSVTQLSSTDVSKLNDEDLDVVSQLAQVSSPNAAFGFIFPELRDLSGYQMYCSGGHLGFGVGNCETSTDTTNFIDGTWTSQGTFAHNTNPSLGLTRTGITGISATGIRAIRFRFGNTNAGCDWAWMHLFGSVASGQNPNRLVLWHPTLNQRVGPAHFDWGNVPRGSSADVSFRVKNNSASLTANSIVVSTDAPSDTTPSVANQHTLNLNGGSFAATQTISSLSPGAISQVLTLRRVTPSNAVLSLWTARVKAAAGSWT